MQWILPVKYRPPLIYLFTIASKTESKAKIK
jgi:hypothetical protein